MANGIVGRFYKPRSKDNEKLMPVTADDQSLPIKAHSASVPDSTAPAEDPQENFHALLPSFDGEAADEEWIATRVLPGGPWIRKNRKLAFGVYGYIRETARR